MTGDLARDRLGERDHPPLGGGVDRLPRAPDAPRIRRDVHDGPAPFPCDHPLEGNPRSVDDAHEVDPDDLLPVLRGRGEKGSNPVPPRVVHPDVHSAELRPDLVSRLPHLRVGGDVGRDVEKPGAGLVRLPGQRIRRPAPDIQNRHVSTLPEETNRHRKPDSPRPSRHHRHLAPHGHPPLSDPRRSTVPREETA